ncbi:MAG: DJ-1/PfpI family protein [Puniceicoccales bacterium]|jgi:4-methyl-5(b-hydroxyethyl)-thiazole monophosphate biosynthesis|nr:DJ-1/PfpI family protein [Puniceicoccales bacterium]
MSSDGKRVIVPLAAGFEEIEAVVPVDLLRRAGAEVVVAHLGEDALVVGRSGIGVRAEVPFGAVADAAMIAGAFDMLVLPGGPGVGVLRADGRVVACARAMHEAGRWVGAICAAPLVLRDAGVLGGRRFTAHFSTRGELPEALTGAPVVRDGNVITSRGAGTAVAFGLELVRAIAGEGAGTAVAGDIML